MAATAAVGQPMRVRLGANLDGKIEIVGAMIQPGTLLPGEQGRVTAYYRVLAPLDQDYEVFVHVEDPDGRMERLNVDHAAAGGTRPASQWQVGETITDEYVVYVPPNSQVRALNIYTGFWRGDSRMHLTNPDKVRSDGKDRVLLATVPVSQ